MPDKKKVIELGNEDLKLIQDLIKSYTDGMPLGTIDQEDPEKIAHIKQGYQGDTRFILETYQRKLELQGEILKMIKLLEDTHLDPKKNAELWREIKNLTMQNFRFSQEILKRLDGYKNEANLLDHQQSVKQEIHKLLAKEELKEESLDLIAKNQNIVKPKLQGRKIIFKFGHLILRFRIINENKEKGTIDLAHLIDKEREDTQTLSHYKDIPIAMRKQELQRRIHLLRTQITEWAYQNKEAISKIREEGFRARLSAFGVFTKEEIEGLIKAVMEKGSPIINKLMDEYKNKLEKMKAELTPPQDFQAKFRFDAEMQKLVNAIDKDKIAISPKDKIEYLARVEQEIIAPMINYWREVWKVDNAIWTANLQRIINERTNYYAGLEKPQSQAQSAMAQRHVRIV